MHLLKRMTRRRLLRGLLDGGRVALALPFLDCFLDDNGTALAGSGAPLPLRFGTWYWGLGHTPGHAVRERTQTGSGIEFLEETRALRPWRDQMTFFSGFNMPLDGRSNYTHYTGWVGSRTGSVPASWIDIPAPTLDLLVADAIGGSTRFRTLDVSAVGIARENYSARSGSSRAATEVSPLALYARLFGEGFVDPNDARFTPDPAVMVQKSVLSAFTDESRSFARTLGAADRARLDEYFTSIRQVENQLALQLEPPARNEACVRPAPPPDAGTARAGSVREMDSVIANHEMLAKLVAMAVACNQTRVFNVIFTDNFATVRRKGETYTHHLLTHEEAIDPRLGYQPTTFWFNQRAMEAMATFIGTLAGIREGAGTLLDNCLVFASSETNYARLHTVDGLPVYFIGRAQGRVRTGLHVVGQGDPVTRIGLTAMQAMGVPIERWGSRSLETRRPVTEVVAG